jgi:hypothetical protein
MDWTETTSRSGEGRRSMSPTKTPAPLTAVAREPLDMAHAIQRETYDIRALTDMLEGIFEDSGDGLMAYKHNKLGPGVAVVARCIAQKLSVVTVNTASLLEASCSVMRTDLGRPKTKAISAAKGRAA